MDEEPTPRCPACKDAVLEPREQRGASYLGCPDCEGAFITAQEMADYVESRTQDQAAGHAFLKILRASILQDEEDGARLRRCPRCDDYLERLGFGDHPFAIIDHCPAHGLWLDDGDFGKLLRQSRATARVATQGPPGEPRSRSYTSSLEKDPQVCPNCGRRYPLSHAQRCDDCNVALYTDG